LIYHNKSDTFVTGKYGTHKRMKTNKACFITIATGELGNKLSVYLQKLKNSFVFKNRSSFKIISFSPVSKKLIAKALLLCMLSALTHFANAQKVDSTKSVYHINGDVSVTNNGFSFIPSFSLGKPATIADLSIGGNRFSFDPQFRFDMEGFKPWSFIFIWRYKLIQTDRFQMKAGVHLPALAFSEQTILTNGVTREQVVPYRFITPELMPTCILSRNISIGIYYIYGIGLEKADQTKQTHFISLRGSFSKVHLTKQFYLKWSPQIYYLNMDGKDGTYVAHSLSLAHEKLPVSVTTTMNKTLQSEIETRDFDWNISLVYSFRNQLVKN
jgi:hypothetical protein